MLIANLSHFVQGLMCMYVLKTSFVIHLFVLRKWHFWCMKPLIPKPQYPWMRCTRIRTLTHVKAKDNLVPMVTAKHKCRHGIWGAPGGEWLNQHTIWSWQRWPCARKAPKVMQHHDNDVTSLLLSYNYCCHCRHHDHQFIIICHYCCPFHYCHYYYNYHHHHYDYLHGCQVHGGGSAQFSHWYDVEASQFTSNSTVYWKILPNNNNKSTKRSASLALCDENPRMSGGFPHNEPLMCKVVLCHGIKILGHVLVAHAILIHVKGLSVLLYLVGSLVEQSGGGDFTTYQLKRNTSDTSYTGECHYNAFQFITISHVALWWQQQNINQTSNSQ